MASLVGGTFKQFSWGAKKNSAGPTLVTRLTTALRLMKTPAPYGAVRPLGGEI